MGDAFTHLCGNEALTLWAKHLALGGIEALTGVIVKVLHGRALTIANISTSIIISALCLTGWFIGEELIVFTLRDAFTPSNW